MYAAHRQGAPDESSDWVILSPGVPVFRRDDGFVTERWRTSFATCAAPSLRLPEPASRQSSAARRPSALMFRRTQAGLCGRSSYVATPRPSG
jgi:uncharacterized protein (TIGR02452 family)